MNDVYIKLLERLGGEAAQDGIGVHCWWEQLDNILFKYDLLDGMVRLLYAV